MDNILEIKNITKNFRGLKKFRLNDISFNIPYGSVTGLIGENGAGKTSLIRTILNVYARDFGEIKGFGGLDNVADEAEFKERTGFITDESYLRSGATIYSTNNVFAAAFKNWDQGLFEKYANMWGFEKKQLCARLSKGQKIRLMTALSLAHKPELLIIDEATSGLDPLAREEMLDLIRDFTEDGMHSVLMSTHITGDLDKIADYLVMINEGSITESISVDDFQDKYVHVSGTAESLDPDFVIGKKIIGSVLEGIALRKNIERFRGADIRAINFEEFIVHMMLEKRRMV